MITQAERAAARRQEKLDALEERVKDGSLLIRKMTDEERLRYPVLPAKAKKAPRR
jgi:hypothetical protein